MICQLRYLVRSGTANAWNKLQGLPAYSPALSVPSLHLVEQQEQIDGQQFGQPSFSKGCRPFSSLLGAVTPAPSKLDSIIRLEEWKTLDTQQVLHLWHGYYDERASEAAGSITAQQWNMMQQRMKECPFSLLPLYKQKPADSNDGSESFMMFLAQAQLPQHILFTPLAEYQEHQTNAVPHMVSTFYSELVSSKDVCLARCDIMNTVHLDKSESVRLLSDTALCYTKDEVYEHVKAINQGSDKFDLHTFLKDLREFR